MTARGAPAVLASVTLGVACAGAVAASGIRTQTHIYRAFTATGKPATRVTRTASGSCFVGSLAIDRDDAWRCGSAGVVYDPCFSSSKLRGIVLCPLFPWRTTTIEIKLTKRLPQPDPGKPSTTGLPWALQTTAGATCLFNTGGANVIGRVRANYFCTNSKDELWGTPSRKSQPWRIYSAPPTAKRLTRRVRIRIAWF